MTGDDHLVHFLQPELLQKDGPSAIEFCPGYRQGLHGSSPRPTRIEIVAQASVWLQPKRPVRIDIADLVGAPVPIPGLPAEAEGAAVSRVAEADPGRPESRLKVVLEGVAALRAALEHPASVVVHDLLVIMAAEPAEKRLPPLHLRALSFIYFFCAARHFLL